VKLRGRSQFSAREFADLAATRCSRVLLINVSVYRSLPAFGTREINEILKTGGQSRVATTSPGLLLSARSAPRAPSNNRQLLYRRI